MQKLSQVFKENSGYQMFLISMITFGLSYGLYKGVIDNYLAKVVSMTSFDKGVSEFFRELPGLLILSAILGLCNSAYAATIKMKKIKKSGT